MVGMNPRLSQEAIAQELVAKAMELWGRQRALAIQSVLEEAAEYLWVVAQNPPGVEEEPAFFL